MFPTLLAVRYCGWLDTCGFIPPPVSLTTGRTDALGESYSSGLHNSFRQFPTSSCGGHPCRRRNRDKHFGREIRKARPQLTQPPQTHRGSDAFLRPSPCTARDGSRPYRHRAQSKPPARPGTAADHTTGETRLPELSTFMATTPPPHRGRSAQPGESLAVGNDCLARHPAPKIPEHPRTSDVSGCGRGPPERKNFTPVQRSRPNYTTYRCQSHRAGRTTPDHGRPANLCAMSRLGPLGIRPLAGPEKCHSSD
ncbi:hypothetical protein Bbelb_228070 [Branchiostoma belcheri]|nr:hypothetical protein Bbelb_228070 [Branchiostoma belcheri]